MTPEKLKDLRRRMVSHTDVNGIAVVVLTAKELQELLDIADSIEACEFPTEIAARRKTPRTPTGLTRIKCFGQENPRDQVRVILSGIVGDLHNMSEGIRKPEVQVPRMTSMLQEAQELLKTMPEGEWEK